MFLEVEANFIPEMILLLLVVLAPWVFVIIKFGILRKLRIRYFVEGNLYFEAYYKYKEEILPVEEPKVEGKEFVGWYREEDLILPFELKKMPDKNLKVYAKFK